MTMNDYILEDLQLYTLKATSLRVFIKEKGRILNIHYPSGKYFVKHSGV